MMDYIYVKLKTELKLGDGEREKSNEANRKKNSDELLSNKLKNQNREKLLNAFLQKFLENNFKKKVSDKNEMEKCIQIFFEENIKIKFIYELISKNKLDKESNYYESIKKLIEGIKDDIENKNIIKKNLKNFLKMMKIL
jgi:hypothetical protein